MKNILTDILCNVMLTLILPQITNMIYLESPAGVGFSYSADKNYSTDDDDVGLI